MKEQNEDEMETDEPFTFKRATSERFVVSGTDIGDLISLEIEVILCSQYTVGLKFEMFL